VTYPTPPLALFALFFFFFFFFFSQRRKHRRGSAYFTALDTPIERNFSVKYPREKETARNNITE